MQFSRALYFANDNLGSIFMTLFSRFIGFLSIENLLTKAKFVGENFSDVTVKSTKFTSTQNYHIVFYFPWPRLTTTRLINKCGYNYTVQNYSPSCCLSLIAACL